MTKQWLCVMVLCGMAVAGRALDSSDLLFHLSFDDGIQPEFARGSADIATMPSNQTARLVSGLFGKGYLCAGKDSTIRYFTGGQNGRNCWEMYGATGNLHGEAGTLSFWYKPLTNTHNMARHYFRCDDRCLLAVARNQYIYYGFNYMAKNGLLYDIPMPPDQWHHIVVTWRKDEARGYLDGAGPGILRDTGVLTPTPEKFTVAAEGQSWIDFQKKEFEDDTILDEMQIFRRPLTDEEVRSLFERGRTTVSHSGGVNVWFVRQPERDYEPARLAAPLLAAPIKPDGVLDDWVGVPAHGGWIERRLGVMDDDPGRVLVACDAQNLYLGYSCEVDESIQKDPTHVWYPAGEFRAEATGRDGAVYGDDYVEFVLKNKAGQEYRLAVNAHDALLDSRDGDKSWNGNIQWKSRSDWKNWSAEIIVPLADLGMARGDVVGFNVIRSWKLFKSSQNTLCTDAHAQPALGGLTLGSPVAASVETLGKPWRGTIAAAGRIVGPAGEYKVSLRGKGYGQAFTNTAKVASTGAPVPFALAHKLDKPGDLAVVLEVVDAAGQTNLTRTIPFVYPAGAGVDLWNYPGWGKLEVKVTPPGLGYTNMHATVALEQGKSAVLSAAIAAFTNPTQTVRFDTKNLATGIYTLVTRVLQGKELVDENRQPYEKKPLPEWYHSQAGVTNGPPIPWTDVRVKSKGFRAKNKVTTVECLLKSIKFQNTLFPAEIVANGQSLLARPICLRVKRGGVEKRIETGDFKITGRTRRQANWRSTVQDGDLKITVDGRVEFDGFTWLTIALASREAAVSSSVERVALEIPLRQESATLTTCNGPLRTNVFANLPAEYAGYWFGNEKAGFQYWWEHEWDWVKAGESVTMMATNGEVILTIPFIQKAVDVRTLRPVPLGWAITPSKPARKDRRSLELDRGGVAYAYADYAGPHPNYAKPMLPPDDPWYKAARESLRKGDDGIICYYAYGPFMWNGAPEYADWYREWSYTPDAAAPDPTSKWVGQACLNSSASDLQLWLLDRYVKEYPQRGIYFDCMGAPSCQNEAHGCGYVDATGVRQPAITLLATRRHHERIYNLMKAADPVSGWVRFHDWGPNMALAAFCDDNWLGEGDCGPLAGSPGKNYYTVLDFPTARLRYAANWGHLVSWLTEMGKYGHMVRPPQTKGTNDPGEWAYAPNERLDHEHVAGLALLHDIWQVGGNSLELPYLWVTEIERLMRWDEHVKFTGYWEMGDWLQVDGRVPEKIECSLYYRPAGLDRPPTDAADLSKRNDTFRRFTVAPEVTAYLRAAGGAKAGWIVLAPMNNTDADVTLTLRPNLAALGVKGPANGRWRDLYRGFDYLWRSSDGWTTGPGLPMPAVFPGRAEAAVFPMKDGAVTVTIPKRNFRMLLLEPRE